MVSSLTGGNRRPRLERSLPSGSDVVQNRVALGVGGLEAEPGDHICGVFSGEAERDQVLIPFLQAGLASGDKCICVVDGTAPGEIVAALGPVGAAAALSAGKQLEVIAASDLYFRSGRFSADALIGACKPFISYPLHPIPSHPPLLVPRCHRPAL